MKSRDDTDRQLLKISSDIKHIREVSSKISEYLKPYNLDETVLFDIRLCVEEAVRNAIVHGNKNDKALSVEIGYWCEDGKLIIEIEDKGQGFDYKEVPDPTKDENIMKGSGRGIYLIRHLMDELEFGDKSNKIRLIKYLK